MVTAAEGYCQAHIMQRPEIYCEEYILSVTPAIFPNKEEEGQEKQIESVKIAALSQEEELAACTFRNTLSANTYQVWENALPSASLNALPSTLHPLKLTRRERKKATSGSVPQQTVSMNMQGGMEQYSN